VALNDLGHKEITHMLNIFCCLILVKEVFFFPCHQAKYETTLIPPIAEHIPSSEEHSSVYFILLPGDRSTNRL
jgi:hypothetical protein